MQARTAERAFDEQVRKHATTSEHLRKTRVLLLHRTQGAHIAHATMTWSLTSRARAFYHWRTVPSSQELEHVTNILRKRQGDYRSPTVAANARAAPGLERDRFMPSSGAPRSR